ncbi:ATP synthase gamma chain [Candidatus Johnevansia muelleri]|uniref:ATP synthase gamma chain n=1 Tax=Candidatus Johnevansia muelleri TaxID=1495769 RepID=A0A078KES1_9GAMM|nr:ATP synthase gamma chain [Candidatus Evansia muelleri]
MIITKEIKTQIKSIESIKKITNAMEMVSASKMRRSQERMYACIPYMHKITKICKNIAINNNNNTYFINRPIKNIGYILITSDRGLCGGLNINVFKIILNDIQKMYKLNINHSFCVLGNKGIDFFKKYGGKLIATKEDIGYTPSINNIIGPVKVMLNAFNEGKIDCLMLVSNKFLNTMIQKPFLQKLLPIHFKNLKKNNQNNYIYETTNYSNLIDCIIVRYIESQVYKSIIENIACEQAARMMAMKNATENAFNIIKELKLIYNKARQAAITQEISEIVNGAAAV